MPRSRAYLIDCRGLQPGFIEAAAEAEQSYHRTAFLDRKALHLMAEDLIYEREQNVIQGKIIEALADRLKLSQVDRRELIGKLRAEFLARQ
jgi:hypothetical protein